MTSLTVTTTIPKWRIIMEQMFGSHGRVLSQLKAASLELSQVAWELNHLLFVDWGMSSPSIPAHTARGVRCLARKQGQLLQQTILNIRQVELSVARMQMLLMKYQGRTK